jgi:uncharacterized protein with GYD domain
MPKYLFKGNYLGESIEALMTEGGTSRRAAVERLVKSVGGTLESMHYAFGDTDIYLIVDLPDNVSAAAASMMANATGVVASSVTVLLTPEEIDGVVAMTPSYEPPGS